MAKGIKETILLVDDEDDLLELVRFNLAKEGYQVRGVSTGEQALAQIAKEPPDLVVLDLMLPGVDGLEICKRLRQDNATKDLPIIMLTAKGEEADIVSGLELGADDYVPKPFSIKVLLAKVKAVLRRKAKPVPDPQAALKCQDIVIHPGRHEVLIKNKPLALTLSEFRILHFLARRPGWVFTRYQIVHGVHGEDYTVTDRTVDVQIVALRKKMGAHGKLIETVRGIGYRFKEQVDSASS